MHGVVETRDESPEMQTGQRFRCPTLLGFPLGPTGMPTAIK